MTMQQLLHGVISFYVSILQLKFSYTYVNVKIYLSCALREDEITITYYININRHAYQKHSSRKHYNPLQRGTFHNLRFITRDC